MAISNAIQFIKQVHYDKELRDLCNQYSSKENLLIELGFDIYEFEDAINMQFVKCQTYEDAQNIRQLKLWFLLL